MKIGGGEVVRGQEVWKGGHDGDAMERCRLMGWYFYFKAFAAFGGLF